MTSHFYIDVSTLWDKQPTGIARVVRKIVDHFVTTYPEQVSFFVNTGVLDFHKCIDSLRTKGHLPQDSRSLVIGDLRTHGAGHRRVGIHPFLPTVQSKFFDYDIQVIYDITPIITPEFHTKGTINDFNSRLEISLSWTDLFVCISEATRKDLVSYLRVPAEKTVAKTLGVFDSHPQVFQGTFDNYASVVGTIEPRKNLSLIFEHFREPSSAEQLPLLKVIGKMGWDPHAKARLDSLNANGRIKYTGFVSETKKLSIIRNSKFSIFASFYEGFGLPVLESIAFGVPVVCSISSSLPEILGDLGVYFDPYSLASFREALTRVNTLALDPSYRKALFDRSKLFKWDGFLNTLATS